MTSLQKVRHMGLLRCHLVNSIHHQHTIQDLLYNKIDTTIKKKIHRLYLIGLLVANMPVYISALEHLDFLGDPAIINPLM